MDKPHAIEFKPDGKVMYVIRSHQAVWRRTVTILPLLGILQLYHMILV